MAFKKIKSAFSIFFLISILFIFSGNASAYIGYLLLDADAITSKYTSMVKGFSFRKSLLDAEGNSVSNLISINSISTEEAELYTTLSVAYYESDNIKNTLKCSMHFTYNPNLPKSKDFMADFAYPLFEILFDSKGYSKASIGYIINFITSSYEVSLIDSSWKIYDSIGDTMIIFSLDKSSSLPILKCEIYKDSYVPKASMNLNSLAVIYNSFNTRSILANFSNSGEENLSFKTTRNGFFLYLESADKIEVTLLNASEEVIYQRTNSGRNAIYVNVPSGTYNIVIKGNDWLVNIGQ